MIHRACFPVLVLLTLVAAGSVSAQCGHPANSTFPGHAVVCPSGDLPIIGQVRDASGNPCAGTVVHLQFLPPATGTLWSHAAYPFPLDSATTNQNGTVMFQPWVGGCELGGTIMFSDNAGVVLGNTLLITSPDLNGDGMVNLSDLSLFATAFFGMYSPCADFNQDGVLNLTDVGIFSGHIGH